jgi:hypothetical protein
MLIPGIMAARIQFPEFKRTRYAICPIIQRSEYGFFYFQAGMKNPGKTIKNANFFMPIYEPEAHSTLC